MKIWRLTLAAALAAGTVAAYVYFPNPVEQASRTTVAPGAEHPESGPAPAEQPPGGGETI
jgi:hypothetical protein